MSRLLALACVALLSVAGLTACGEQDDGADSSASSPSLVGRYAAASPGPILDIGFAGDEYALQTSECGSAPAPCAESGTFALDAARGQLALTNAATGVTRTLPFAVVRAERIAPRAFHAPLHTQGICIVGTPQCPRPPTADSSLVTPNAPTVTPSQQPLVTCSGNCVLEFSANGQLVRASGDALTVTPNR